MPEQTHRDLALKYKFCFISLTEKTGRNGCEPCRYLRGGHSRKKEHEVQKPYRSLVVQETARRPVWLGHVSKGNLKRDQIRVFNSAQFSSVAQSCPTLRNPMNHSTPGLPFHHKLLEFTETHAHQVGDAIQPFILCHPLLLLPPIPPSIRVFSNKSTPRMRWSNYWSVSFSISPCNEHPGLISFRMDWLDLLAVQGTLKNLLQHHSSKASIFRRSAFFTVQLSHPYMTTGKTIALTR